MYILKLRPCNLSLCPIHIQNCHYKSIFSTVHIVHTDVQYWFNVRLFYVWYVLLLYVERCGGVERFALVPLCRGLGTGRREGHCLCSIGLSPAPACVVGLSPAPDWVQLEVHRPYIHTWATVKDYSTAVVHCTVYQDSRALTVYSPYSTHTLCQEELFRVSKFFSCKWLWWSICTVYSI